MKSLQTLHLSVLENLGHHCSIDITRDRQTTSRRCEDEGESYLTITLPLLAKALERGLETGQWPAQDVNSKWDHIRGLPAYMRGFLSRVFDEKSGALLATPDVECIWAVRQFCYLTNKIERACTPEREKAAFDQFVATDRSLLGLPGRLDRDRLDTYRRVAKRLFGRVFQDCDLVIANWELIPKHGPGAVAEKASQKERRDYSFWHDRLETVFPYWRYTANSVYQSSDQSVPISDEQPVRVVSVPKTQSTPRIIAIEPSVMQYAQQGLKREFYQRIGNAKNPLSRVLGFQDQTRNREMARQASLDGKHGTLDLSEASDRVHWFLVREILRDYPHLWEFVWNTRSHRADVPFHGVIPLQKFASMGSALTFPLEAIVFTTLAVCGVEQAEHRRLQARDLPGLVSVYGDDIIVPVDAIDHVIDWLEHFGAKVNRRKSFWNGKFRESCGAEYYDGTDVSVVRMKHELPSSRDDAAEIAALVDFRNRAFMAGLWSVVSEIDEGLDPFIRLPYANASSDERHGFIHAATFLPVRYTGTRWSPTLHQNERRVPVLVGRSDSYRADGEAGLLEWFHDALSRGDLVNRFDSQERASSFSIKRRWVRAVC
jgi:hypothetical protein